MLVKILLAFAVVLFLTYPAAVLTTIIEGQSPQAIYSVHLPVSVFSLGIMVFIISIWFIKFKNKNKYFDLYIPRFKKEHLILGLIIGIYCFFVFSNLGRADIIGDDYDLAYQAYNLHDGILAARKAYILSFNTHPPLFMTIKHYWFQFVSPFGLETVPAWGYRGMEGILGIATILAAYLIVRDFVNKKAALATAVILAVNNYMVFLGRVYLREMYLTFFVTLSIYFFLRKNYLITAFLIGCGLLVKTSAIVVLPVFLGILIWQKVWKGVFGSLGIIGVMYLPVLIYNLGAYITTGKMDATFSRVFGLPHPFLTGSSSFGANISQIINIFSDIYSWPVFLVFVVATGLSLIPGRNRLLLTLTGSSLIFFIFGGPLREYYLLFLTIPFAIITADTFYRLRKAGLFMLAVFIIYSFWYLLSGRSGIRDIYEPVYGWPKIAAEVKANYKEGDCLEKSGGVNDLTMRAYFQTDDTVKETMLGPNYPHFYKMCDEIPNPLTKFRIYYNENGFVQFKIL